MDAAAKFLNKAAKPVLVGGVKLRPLRAEKEFVELADACGELICLSDHEKYFTQYRASCKQ